MLSKGQAVVKQNCSKEAFPGKYFLGINAASHERGIKNQIDTANKLPSVIFSRSSGACV